MSYDNKEEIQIESKFIELNISDGNVDINHENCYNSSNKKPWCKECVPRCIIEGWTSENNDIDEFIKDTIYNAKLIYDVNNANYNPEWVPFDKFKDIKHIGEGGFAKVYSATWIDGKSKYFRQNDGSWKKRESEPIEVALKKLNDSQNISADYLNELKTHWKLYNLENYSLKFYGITKDPETKEFMMIIQLADRGNLRSVLSSNFNNLLWKAKIFSLYYIAIDLKNLHQLGYFHKDFHTYRCMSANPDQRPTASELYRILNFWYNSCNNNIHYQEKDKFGYKGKEIKAIFDEANEKIPNISTSYEKNPDAIYTSRVFTFSNLPKPVDSSIITSYLNDDDEGDKDCQDSKLFDLEVSN
ncbi:kinase-like domain-containing protein [Rhizophagus irregularis DAOM 181602=DAOM 197198]|nr:kinase-like domain-containing protein [Rhizophagus irregularis DAOM 181602=DAOM 197198]